MKEALIENSFFFNLKIVVELQQLVQFIWLVISKILPNSNNRRVTTTTTKIRIICGIYCEHHFLHFQTIFVSIICRLMILQRWSETSEYSKALKYLQNWTA